MCSWGRPGVLTLLLVPSLLAPVDSNPPHDRLEQQQAAAQAQQQQQAAVAAATAILQQQHAQQQQHDLAAAQQVVAAQQRSQPQPLQPLPVPQEQQQQLAAPGAAGVGAGAGAGGGGDVDMAPADGAGGGGSVGGAAAGPPVIVAQASGTEPVRAVGGLRTVCFALQTSGGARAAKPLSSTPTCWVLACEQTPTSTPTSTSTPTPQQQHQSTQQRRRRRRPRQGPATRGAAREFLARHTAYELIPESGRAVALDADLPARAALHALHEQGASGAPVWDAGEATVIGVVAASDFIVALQRLRGAAGLGGAGAGDGGGAGGGGGGGAPSEAELDEHTVRGMREAAAQEGRPPPPLVFVRPEQPLAEVVAALHAARVTGAPVLSCDPNGGGGGGGGAGAGAGGVGAVVLHVATLGGVLACLLRHFRASLASLPLLAQPIGAVGIGTWADPSVPLGSPGGLMPVAAIKGKGSGGGDAAAVAAAAAAAAAGGKDGGAARPPGLLTVAPSTPLVAALDALLEAGVGALPVVDEAGRLLGAYARCDVARLCAGGAYQRLLSPRGDAVTVAEALALPASPAITAAWGSGSGGGAFGPGGAPPPGRAAASAALTSAAVVARDDPLRAALEALAAPGVRRAYVVERGTGRLEGVVSVTDVVRALFL